MSLLSGILSGGLFGYSNSLGKGIDSSHHPFKRSRRRPGGPAGVSSEETREWTCSWKKPYVQVCTNTETGRKKTVKVKKAEKLEYNKRYRHAKPPYPRGKQFKRKTARPGAKYRPPSAKWLKHKKTAKRATKAPRKGRKS